MIKYLKFFKSGDSKKMLRQKTLVLSVVFSLLSLVILPFQTNGQTTKSLLQIEKPAVTKKLTNPTSSLFLKSESDESRIRASLDGIEKEQYKSSSNSKRALSKKAKTGIFIGIGAVIAVVVIAVLVSRNKNNDDNRLFCAIPEGCTN